ncbi:MAG: DNA mismatch endonuclease Vsr [Deltaproteobacteria bacterium]|nr:DNA mismatch endonuclease Vsr [Deltaproteobacteria bacterium]
MADIVSKEVRSKMMSGIKGKNTKPEIMIRHRLFAMGFRYRLHARDLPGNPDLVFPKYRAVIFVNGCFWHGHNCHLFKWPTTNADFWKDKIHKTICNDSKKTSQLIESGWRVFKVWECSIKNRLQYVDEVVLNISKWLVSDEQSGELKL